MPKGYHHLTNFKRYQLYSLKKRGESSDQIAKELNVHRSTVYRELMRNRRGSTYSFEEAHNLALQRRRRASRERQKLSADLTSLIEKKLCLQWSPEQIAGWLRKNHYSHRVCHETIYQYILKDKRSGGRLYANLRRRGKKYNKRSSTNAGRGCIPNRVDIEKRPAIVEEKARLGDWELDTIIGKNHKGAIVSMVDRASKLVKLVKIPRRTALEVSKALLDRLVPIKKFVLTLTSDNGKEFAQHGMISQRLGASFFFATPYHSWERGLNEHTNGLVRQYFPKSTSFEDITQEKLHEVELLLNNRPRKVLDFLSPIEVFNTLRSAREFVALHT